MKILALTFGSESAASSLYRVYQYIEPLAREGIELEACPAGSFERWDLLDRYDAVLIQKKLFRTGRVRFIRRRVRRLIYDVDDAIWEPHGWTHHWFTRWRTRRRLHCVASLADGCIAANGVLAAELRRHTKRAVEIIPMSLDEAVWHPAAAKSSGPLRIGWAGAPANLPYLTAIEPALLTVQRAHPEVEIVVYCGHAPDFTGGLKATHVPFQPGVEPEVVRSFDIGLLPLPDNAFAQGKSPIKGLQYMACGVAVVASPVGATREIFQAGGTVLFAGEKSEWQAMLSRLINEAELRKQISREANAEFRSRYTCSKVARNLANVFHSLIAESGGR